MEDGDKKHGSNLSRPKTGRNCPAEVGITVLTYPDSGSQLLCRQDRKRATGSSRNLRHGDDVMERTSHMAPGNNAGAINDGQLKDTW
jgi:hypothetical protein